jgi:hypothetical protein
MFTRQVPRVEEDLPMWTIRLSDRQRDALRMLLQSQGQLGPSLSGALESLELARWDELPDAELPWDRVAALAAMQGIDEADVVWDLASGLKVPAKLQTATPRR